jgi:hypothetical protein
MNTSLMPPGLVVVSTRIGRSGQSAAAAPKHGMSRAKQAIKYQNERRTDVLPSRFAARLACLFIAAPSQASAWLRCFVPLCLEDDPKFTP